MLLSFHDITQDHKSHVWLRPAGSTFLFSSHFCFSGLSFRLSCLGLRVTASALPWSPSALPRPWGRCLGPGLTLPCSQLSLPRPRLSSSASAPASNSKKCLDQWLHHWNLCLICQFVTNMTGRANSTKAYKTAFGNWCTSLDSMDFLQCTCPSWWSTKPYSTPGQVDNKVKFARQRTDIMCYMYATPHNIIITCVGKTYFLPISKCINTDIRQYYIADMSKTVTANTIVNNALSSQRL